MIPIDYPTKAETDEQISAILQRVMPRKRFFASMQELFFQVGLRRIFIGMSPLFFILFFYAASFCLFLYKFYQSSYVQENGYGLFFFLSPISFLLVYLLSICKEKEDGVFEVQMSCRYTYFELFTFRMIAFSLLCLLLSFAFSGIFSYDGSTWDFWKMYSLSACSQLLVSLLLLVPFRKSPLLCVGFAGFIWLGGFFTYFWFHQEMEYLLRLLPDFLFGLLALLFAVLYILRLRTLFFYHKRRDFDYAIR